MDVPDRIKEAKFTQLAVNVDGGLSGFLSRTLEVEQKVFAEHLKSKERQAERAVAEGLSRWARLPKSVFGLPMIDPRSQFAVTWAAFMILMDATYTAFWVPINVGFCTLYFGDLSFGCNYVDLVGGAIYFLNTILSFQMGAVLLCGVRQSTCMDGYIVLSVYSRTERFIVDVLAVVPLFYLIVILAGDFEPNRAVHIVSLIRLFRMARIFSLSKILYSEATSGRLSRFLAKIGGVVAAYLLILVYILCMIVNLEASILILVANLQGPEDSWMVTYSFQDVPNSSHINQWYCAVFWSISTSSNTGSSGFLPITYTEVVLTSLIMLLGMVCFGLMVVAMSRYLTTASEETKMVYKLRNKIERVHSWMRSRKIPPMLATEVHDFFMQMWVKRSETVKPDDVLQQLPRYLRKQVLIEKTSHLISSVQALCGLKDDTRVQLGNRLIQVEVAAGVHLWNEGDEPDGVWLLESGTIEALNLFGDSQVLTPPAVIGEAVILADQVIACRERLWTYTTTSACTLWHLPMSRLGPLLLLCPDLAKTLLAYTQIKLLQSLSGWVSDGQWSEVVQRLTATFHGASGEAYDAILKQLQTCSRQDGSLQLFLDALLELSTLKVVEVEDLNEALAVPEAAQAIRKVMEGEGCGEEGVESEEDRKSDSSEEERIETILEASNGLAGRDNVPDQDATTDQLGRVSTLKGVGGQPLGRTSRGLSRVSQGLSHVTQGLTRVSRKGNSALISRIEFKLSEEDDMRAGHGRRGSVDLSLGKLGSTARKGGLASRSVLPTYSAAAPSPQPSGWSFSPSSGAPNYHPTQLSPVPEAHRSSESQLAVKRNNHLLSLRPMGSRLANVTVSSGTYFPASPKLSSPDMSSLHQGSGSLLISPEGGHHGGLMHTGGKGSRETGGEALMGSMDLEMLPEPSLATSSASGRRSPSQLTAVAAGHGSTRDLSSSSHDAHCPPRP